MKRILFALFLSAALLLSACSETAASSSASTTASGVSTSTEDSMFTARDMEIGYDESTCAVITLNGTSASCDSDAVTISDSTITIADEGTYLFRGSLDDGMIIVDADDNDDVQLVLDGVTIANADGAAIYVCNADKVVITTSDGSENTLSNGGSYTAIDDNNIDAVVFAKSDLTFNGAGTLTIQAAAGHGAVSKDDLALTSGTYVITAASHGLSGKDSVRIASGSYTITSGKDGIHAENADDASLGFVYIANGTFDITADGDGISSAAYQQILAGSFSIVAGGGSGEAVTQTTETFPGRGGETMQAGETIIEEDTSSTKGIKAGGNLSISGGTFTIDSADDALHSNSDIFITDGTYEIATGDDGVHADNAVEISGGTMNILQSYEGLEGLTVTISGGEISVISIDDGMNAAGGTDSSGTGFRGDSFAADADAAIVISGGTVAIDAEGDGIDSNGSLTVSGGETYVYGPVSSGNGALDYNGEASITGGLIVAFGPTGMAQNFGDSSTQGSILVSISGSAGDTVTLTDADGAQLVSRQSKKAFSSVLISCPDLVQGESYTLASGESSTQITLDSLIYGESGGGMVPDGTMPDGATPGERPGGQRQSA